MLKKMKFKIESFIENLHKSGLADGDAERTDFTADGEYGYRDGIAKIAYRETGESGETDCNIVLKGDTVTVKRDGSSVVEMKFRDGEEFNTLYRVPPFSFDMKIVTKRAEYTASADGVSVRLLYKMEIGGQDKLCRFKLESV